MNFQLQGNAPLPTLNIGLMRLFAWREWPDLGIDRPVRPRRERGAYHRLSECNPWSPHR